MAGDIVLRCQSEKSVASANSLGNGPAIEFRVRLKDFARLRDADVNFFLDDEAHGLDAVARERRLLHDVVLDAERLDDFREVRADRGAAGGV